LRRKLEISSTGDSAADVALGFLVQQADNLPLGDEDAERLYHLHKSRHGHLPLVILRQNKPAQFRPEVSLDAVRQRSGQRGAIRSHPALAAKFHDVSA